METPPVGPFATLLDVVIGEFEGFAIDEGFEVTLHPEVPFGLCDDAHVDGVGEHAVEVLKVKRFSGTRDETLRCGPLGDFKAWNHLA
jgi:hypothetical protein